MLSYKSKYALKKLIVLTKEYGQRPLLIASITRREEILPEFLELILLELRNRGLCRAKKAKARILPRSVTTKDHLGEISAGYRRSAGAHRMCHRDGGRALS